MRTEEQLKESLKEIHDLKAALDEHAIVAITDPQGKITYVNDKFCAISKYSRDELLGQDHRIINSSHHPKEFIRDLWTTIARGNVWKGEIKNRARDGSFYWVDTTIVPFLNEHGKPRQYVAIRADITERKRAEAAAAQLAAIVESSDDAIIGKDLRGIVTSWNAGAERLFGYAAAEMIGQPIMRLIPPERYSEETEILARIQRGESVRHFDTERLRKDGSLIPISVTVSPIKDSNGNVIGASKIVGASKVARNITERKRAEEQLRGSYKEIADLKAALDEHAIVAITDPQGKITYVNDKFCAISKYSRDELLGQDHRIINSGHHSKEFIRDLWTTIARGKVWKGEIKNRARDGSFYWVDTTIVPFLNEHGKPRQYVAIRADVTERKRAEEQLSGSYKEIADLKAALDEHAIVAITDPQGKITYVNDKFCAISKYSRDELLGQDHRIINSGHHSKEFIRDLWTTIARGKVWKGEIKNRARDGSFYWVDTTIVPFLNEHGKPYQYVAIRADITERKLAEDEIKKLNSDLEQRVSLRTNELKAANEELESFSYSISHDLRAPLRAMGGFTRILEKQFAGPISDDARHAMERIRVNAAKMSELIDGLLDFSGLGRSSLVKNKLDPAAMVRAVLDELPLDADGREVKLEIAELPPCKADATLLKQVFANLLSNALKYSRARNPAVITVGSLQEKNETVYFVRDNGAGFDMKYADKLFHVFQRLHRADQFEGTGVGLAIVQRIVQRHGGRIWAESRVDAGATFYFTL